MRQILVILLTVTGILANMFGDFSPIISWVRGSDTDSKVDSLYQELALVNHQKYINKYPEGYVVFFINDRKEFKIPDTSILANTENYQVDLLTAKVLKITES